MSLKRSWTDDELVKAVKTARSYRTVIMTLRLIPAGGNYVQVKRRIKELGLTTEHFKGMGWNRDLRYHTQSRPPLKSLLTLNSYVQSYKLKMRLFEEGVKKPECELCGWSKHSTDGRIPVELDHINGEHTDNRLKNLRILCPNCHSLQPTHRGRNKKVSLRYARVVE